VLQCVQVADGERVWQVDTMEKYHVVQNFFGVGSSPLVWNDLLIVQVGGSPPGSPPHLYAGRGNVRASGSAVVAFDKRTGTERWRAGDDLASYASPVAATVNGQEVVYLFARSGLLVIDPAKGETLAQFPWRAVKLESVNASSPVAVGNEVFISETYKHGSALLRFTGDGLEEVWTDRDRRRNRALALHWNTAIEHAGYLYGSSGYHSGEAQLRCVAWRTGEVLWSEPGLERSSLLLIDGVLVCLSEDGIVRLLRATPEKYEELAEWELTDASGTPLLTPPAWVAPALAEGLLYLQGKDRLVCLELIPRN
ncbi:MAG: PQQ-binding-like beta-propeller repeat protein, partial [Aeoliella sp.]